MSDEYDYICHVTRTDESWYMRRVTRNYKSWHTWVMSRALNESKHANNVRMSHGTRVNESRHACQ